MSIVSPSGCCGSRGTASVPQSYAGSVTISSSHGPHAIVPAPGATVSSGAAVPSGAVVSSGDEVSSGAVVSMLSAPIGRAAVVRTD